MAVRAVSILSFVINSSSVLEDYLLRGHFMVVECGAPSDLEQPTSWGGVLLGQHVTELQQDVPLANDVIAENYTMGILFLKTMDFGIF